MRPPAHVLVTGGAGFIGSHTVDALLDAGHRVTVLDDLSTGDRLNLASRLGEPALLLIEGDVSRPLGPSLAPAVARFGRVERVVHLAAQTSVIQSLEDPVADLRVNVGGTLEVISYSREVGARHVVFASSAAVYGDAPELPVSEGRAPSPISVYGVHKLASEHHLRVAATLHGLPSTSLRFFNVFGPRQAAESPYSGVISIFFARALANAPLTVHGDGAQTRDMVYVRDVVDAIVRALFRDVSGATVCNVGRGEETTVRELAERVIEFAKSNSPITHGPARAGEILRSRADIALARETLGYEPRVDVAAGLAETARWFADVRATTVA